ncbi:MAG: hypothetical protein OES14_02900 [Nitrosopumilus sp.]|nr:hypothetical protein [Nitrosopumilus sp.]
MAVKLAKNEYNDFLVTDIENSSLYKHLEFLFEIDFLGIISSMASLKESILTKPFDINHKDFLIDVRRKQAIVEAYFTSDDTRLLLENNTAPWLIHHDHINENNFQKVTTDPKTKEKIKKYLLDMIFEEPTKEPSNYFVDWSNDHRKTEVEKNRDVPAVKRKFKKEIIDFLKKENKNSHYSINICYNPSTTNSMILRKNMDLATILCNQIIENKACLDSFTEKIKSQQNYEIELLNIIPYVGIMNKRFLNEDMPIKEFNSENIDETYYHPSVIYFLCNFQTSEELSLDDIRPQFSTLINDFIQENENLVKILNDYSKMEEDNFSYYLNYCLMRKIKNPKNIGGIFFISSTKLMLEKIDPRKLSQQFHLHQKEKIKNWESLFSIEEEVSQFIIKK